MVCFVNPKIGLSPTMANKKSLIILLFSILFQTTFASVLTHENLTIDRIFQLGDSLSDTGNLIRDSPSGARNPCGHLPYGITLNRSTGRCSDGLLMVDYFAESFGLPSLSPYLDKGGDFKHGVNFAVAGSTALDTVTLQAKGVTSPVTNSSLSVQLNWFKSHLKSICHTDSDCKQLRNSLILMGEIGGNDYNYALLEMKTMDELRGMVPDVVQSIKEAVEVINLGAIRMVIPGNFPIGCMPIYLSTFISDEPRKFDELNCLRDLNEFAKFHNDHLQQAIRDLQEQHPSVTILYCDFYSGLRWILKNAPSLGFDKDMVQKACGGASDKKYNFDMRQLCGAASAEVCANPAARFSWDGVHLTQHAHYRMAQFFLRSILPQLSV